jgi:hypothetical protein
MVLAVNSSLRECVYMAFLHMNVLLALRRRWCEGFVTVRVDAGQ